MCFFCRGASLACKYGFYGDLDRQYTQGDDYRCVPVWLLHLCGCCTCGAPACVHPVLPLLAAVAADAGGRVKVLAAHGKEDGHHVVSAGAVPPALVPSSVAPDAC